MKMPVVGFRLYTDRKAINILSTVIFFAVYYGLRDLTGNNALWFASLLFLVARGVLQ